MYWWKKSRNVYSKRIEVNYMATTGELQAIIEELHLIDVGDAASYLGEEATENAEAVFDAILAQSAQDEMGVSAHME